MKPLKASDGLTLGALLLVLAAFLFVLQGVLVHVTTISAPLTAGGLVYEASYQYKCGTLSTDQCALIYNAMTGAASILSFMGAVLVAVSLFRLTEAPHVSGLPPPPPRLGLCPKCGAMNSPTSKYCSECATKLR